MGPQKISAHGKILDSRYDVSQSLEHYAMFFTRLLRDVCAILPSHYVNQHAFSDQSLQVFIEPVEGSFERIHAMSRLAKAVTFTWIAHQHRLDATAPKSHVHLLSL